LCAVQSKWKELATTSPCRYPALAHIHTPIICYKAGQEYVKGGAVVRWLLGKEAKPDFTFFFVIFVFSNFVVVVDVVPKN
jgi:hypothetical protein